MNSARSNSLSLKNQRFTSSGCKDIRIRKFSLWQRLKVIRHQKAGIHFFLEFCKTFADHDKLYHIDTYIGNIYSVEYLIEKFRISQKKIYYSFHLKNYVLVL